MKTLHEGLYFEIGHDLKLRQHIEDWLYSLGMKKRGDDDDNDHYLFIRRDGYHLNRDKQKYPPWQTLYEYGMPEYFEGNVEDVHYPIF